MIFEKVRQALFVIIWARVLEIMAGYVFWAQVAQMYFLGPKSQSQ